MLTVFSVLTSLYMSVSQVKIKEEPKVKEAKVKKEEKAEVKAEVKTEVKAEATTEAVEAVGGSETGSHSASPAAVPKKPASEFSLPSHRQSNSSSSRRNAC